MSYYTHPDRQIPPHQPQGNYGPAPTRQDELRVYGRPSYDQPQQQQSGPSSAGGYGGEQYRRADEYRRDSYDSGRPGRDSRGGSNGGGGRRERSASPERYRDRYDERDRRDDGYDGGRGRDGGRGGMQGECLSSGTANDGVGRGGVCTRQGIRVEPACTSTEPARTRIQIRKPACKRSWKPAPSVVPLVHSLSNHRIAVISDQSMHVHGLRERNTESRVHFFLPDRNPYSSSDRPRRPRTPPPEPQWRGEAGTSRSLRGTDQSDLIASRLRKERPVRTLFVRNISVRLSRRLLDDRKY